MSYEVRHCDNLDPVLGLPSLADRSVDHVITDPPYSEATHNGARVGERYDGTEKREAFSFEPLTHELVDATAAQLVRVARRWIILFCDEFSLVWWASAIKAHGGKYVRRGTWVKADAMPQLSGDRPSNGVEDIAIHHAPRDGGRMRWNRGGAPAVYRGNAQERNVARVHDTQKPVWLMESVLRDFTDAGDIVLDPYAGSGTTLVAARRLGRRAIGLEREAVYADAARGRIETAREQLGLAL